MVCGQIINGWLPGIPVWGVLCSTVVGYRCVVIAALWPDTVFLFLINSSGAVFLFVYLMICASQLKQRSHWECEGLLKFRMWGHPWLPLAVTAIIIAVLIRMALDPRARISLLQSLTALGFILLTYPLIGIRKTASHVLSVE